MKSNLTQIQEWIGMSEGGYVNHPSDPGGATDRGITQATYDSWNRRKGVSMKTVKGISKQEA
ncbi:glycosyl hydrolase 108 family protein, partial [Escherichia coli]|uniref:glycosyl hydrolase 108 family protein n=1 Tax=Escherichia coli TaxID=562 RepID=UPI0013230524